MSRKDQAQAEARSSTLGLDNPDVMAHTAVDGGTPIENMDWRPPETLQAPPPPAGWKYTWIRTALGTIEDGDNIRKMFSQGWRPVLKSEIQPGYFPPTISDARFNNGQETVGVRDMILCKIPTKMKRQRDAYYAAKANTQVREIDKRLHAERQRPGDSFFVDRKSTTDLRKAPLDDTDD